jgi:hypothetical protein
LETLKSTIEPEFQKRKFSVFDVGVDVVETSVKGSIDYAVMVYDSARKLFAYEVLEAIDITEPKYRGKVGVCSGAIPYPVNSFMGLELLKEMKQARE